jgi:hypothetical protein
VKTCDFCGKQADDDAGGHTDVTFVWRVTLPPGILRWTAPLLAPLFRWNHKRVMRAGRMGLEGYLRRRDEGSLLVGE